MLISETHFTSRSHFTLPGYDTCLTHHPDDRAHGGTAILIKSHIAYAVLPSFATPELQSTIITVQGPHRSITIAATYCPPRFNLKASTFEMFFQSLGACFVAGGDFNSKHSLWGSRLDTTKGRELAMVIRKHNYAILSTGTPTYWPTDPNKIPDLLDFFILSGLSTSYADIHPSYDLSSDHSPIIATLSTTIYQNKMQPRLHNSRTNWDTYKAGIRRLLNVNWKLQSQEDIDAAITHFTNSLRRAATAATPLAGSCGTPAPSDSCPSTEQLSHFLPSHIKHLVALKRKARSQWQKTHSPGSRHKFNQASNALKRALTEYRNASFTAYITTLNRDDCTLWRSIRSNRKPQTPNPPIRLNSTPPGPWAATDKDKADLFATYLEDVFTPHDQALDQAIETELAKPVQSTTRLPKFTLQPLQQEIKMLKTRKAPGMDNITSQMLQELPEEGLIKLLHIYNAIVQCNYWPADFKSAQIIMVLKPGKDPTDVTSYRPISLLSTLSKLLEKLISQRISIDTDPNTWVPYHQFSFRKAHSTLQQCHRITHTVNTALEHKRYCTAAFLDVSQAFDKVWHPGLLYKLKRCLPLRYFPLL